MSRDMPGRIHSIYWIQTFGATSADVRFNRLPTVIQKAKAAISGADIDGFLMCALEKPPLMTGLGFATLGRNFLKGCLYVHHLWWTGFTERVIRSW